MDVFGRQTKSQSASLLVLPPFLLNSRYGSGRRDRSRDREPAPKEYRRVAEWFRTREQALWDEQVDRDSAAGKLDFLFQEAEGESEQGFARNWPPSKLRSKRGHLRSIWHPPFLDLVPRAA